jgi:hypothetical protein
VARKAECCPPVELAYLDVRASGVLQDGGIEVSTLVDDAHPSARDSERGHGPYLGQRESRGNLKTAQDAERTGLSCS